MTKEQLNNIEDYLYRLLVKSDRIEDRMEKAELEGDTERLARLDAKDNAVIAEIDGVANALAYLGYTVKHQDDRYVIVKR